MRYVTTPIFYVNAKPHIGHLHSMVFADVVHRWHKFQGRPSRMVTGTDEHGMKVMEAAQLAQKPPKQFVDELSGSFKRLAQAGGISNDRFIRTTDPDHKAKAMKFWTTLDQKGLIYKDKHKGWYCISDETFYPESELEEGPDGLISKETGKQVKWYEEENYFFDLASMKSKLLEAYETSDLIVPSSRKSQLLKEIESLNPLSISRPLERCPWGIPVPNDPNHTMYVWFDALINYLTASEGNWPAEHIIGKDIVRFHCVYWPAFLLAAGLELPRVTVHNHWTFEGVKMSKSLNNVVDPFQAISDYGLDAVRYFLMHDASLDHDTPFSHERLIERHNVNLVNKLGNLVSRVCGPRFNVGDSLSAGVDPVVEHEISSTLADCEHLAQNHQFSRILHRLNDLAMFGNQYFQESEPWALEDPRLVVSSAAKICMVLGLYLQPFIPQYAERVLDRLGVAERSAAGVEQLDYGVGVNKKGAVFAKL